MSILNNLLLNQSFPCCIADEQVEVFEGDTVKFNCSSALTPLAGHGVEWFHNDVKVDPRQHGRIRYSKKKYVKQGIEFDERRFS